MRWIGIDVGGANLKLSDGRAFAQSQPFALWKHPQQLADAIRTALAQSPPHDAVAATMSGELCDCYETKAEGVQQIASSLADAAGDRPVFLYGLEGAFHQPSAASEKPLLFAASNWHALARIAATYLPDQTGLVVDMGSTTTDIVPVVSGEVATESQTDTERLLAGELVYTGIGRTPVCAVVHQLPYRGRECPVAAEFFATTEDVYFLLGTARQPTEARGADGRAMIQQFAVDRLARQIGADRSTFTLEDALVAAEHVRDCQLSRINAAIDLVTKDEPCHAIQSGSGEFLAAKSLATRNDILSVTSLAEQRNPELSGCAAAAAVAVLAAEQQP